MSSETDRLITRFVIPAAPRASVPRAPIIAASGGRRFST